MKASLISVGAVVLAATLVGIVFSALGTGGALTNDSRVALRGRSMGTNDGGMLWMGVAKNVQRLIGYFTDAGRLIAGGWLALDWCQRNVVRSPRGQEHGKAGRDRQRGWPGCGVPWAADHGRRARCVWVLRRTV